MSLSTRCTCYSVTRPVVGRSVGRPSTALQLPLALLRAHLNCTSQLHNSTAPCMVHVCRDAHLNHVCRHRCVVVCTSNQQSRRPLKELMTVLVPCCQVSMQQPLMSVVGIGKPLHAPTPVPCFMPQASKGNVELLQILFQHGAKVNVQDATGSTPLHRAASSGKLEAVRFLVQQVGGWVVQLCVLLSGSRCTTPYHTTCGRAL
jgi:hypothetical protein